MVGIGVEWHYPFHSDFSIISHSPRKFNTLQGSYRKQYFETLGNKERKRKDKVYLK